MIRRAMYTALLRQQFVLQRNELIALTVAAGAIAPVSLLGVRSINGVAAAESLLALAVPLTIFSVIFAATTGLVMAIRAYSADSATRHTYALALPITRGDYALLRALTGISLMLLPLAGYAIGTYLTVAAVPTPPELYAYPFGVTLRCSLALLVCFSFGFALQYGLGRNAGRAFVIGIVLLGIVEIANAMVFYGVLTSDFWRALASDASPFAVFNTQWTLFDV